MRLESAKNAQEHHDKPHRQKKKDKLHQFVLDLNLPPLARRASSP